MFIPLYIVGAIFFIIILIFKTIIKFIKKLFGKHRKQVNKVNLRAYADQLTNQCYKVSPEMFLKLKKQRQLKDFQGCYVIHNETLDKYYVGQSINVIQRVANHIQGRGNSDVYFDLRMGNKFDIAVVDINNTKFRTLNSLEKHLITAYDAYNHGYNKTAGNRG